MPIASEPSLPAALEALPALPIGTFPTPLHPLDRLSEHLGGPRILVKREDLCGIAVGGNKVRKLRCLVADALAEGATAIVTRGGVQSNHCAQTAVVGAQYGLRVVLVLTGDAPTVRSGNLLVDDLVGAEAVYAGRVDDSEIERVVEGVLDTLRSEGERPYLIGLGGSDLLGVLATASAVGEVVTQSPAGPDHVVVATGSVGTTAGIAVGAAAYGLTAELHGVSVLWPAEQVRCRLDALVAEAAEWSGGTLARLPAVHVTDRYLGEGYGIPTPAAREAQALVARCEGLVLDDTYTSKAMAGLLEGIRSGRFAAGDTVLFWHSGGIGGFFAATHG